MIPRERSSGALSISCTAIHYSPTPRTMKACINRAPSTAKRRGLIGLLLGVRRAAKPQIRCPSLCWGCSGGQTGRTPRRLPPRGWSCRGRRGRWCRCSREAAGQRCTTCSLSHALASAWHTTAEARVSPTSSCFSQVTNHSAPDLSPRSGQSGLMPRFIRMKLHRTLGTGPRWPRRPWPAPEPKALCNKLNEAPKAWQHCWLNQRPHAAPVRSAHPARPVSPLAWTRSPSRTRPKN